MIRVHTAGKVFDYPDGNRFSTEEEFNNLCVWNVDKLLAVFADGKWTGVEFVEVADA